MSKRMARLRHPKVTRVANLGFDPVKRATKLADARRLNTKAND